jgi:hypothetical protein
MRRRVGSIAYFGCVAGKTNEFDLTRSEEGDLLRGPRDADVGAIGTGGAATVAVRALVHHGNEFGR